MLQRRKKIILDCDLMKHPHSGLYHYCLNLGQSVQELLKDDRKESIFFYVPPAETRSFQPASACIPERKRLLQWVNRPLLGCDVWHAPFQSGRIVPDKRKYPGTKVLLTIHDLNPLHEGKTVGEQQRSLAHTQSLIDKADALVCISQFCKDDVLRNCNTGNKPVHVIHNGTHRVHAPQLAATSYKPTRPFLFGMGYVNTKKNYHVLLSLLNNEGLELIIAGRLDEPAYIERMKQQAITMGVADRLHIIGPVSEGEKAWYFNNCLAFVHPSLAEGFGAPVVEVMQFGKPIFLSPLTSLPEIGGDTAFYFPSFEPTAMQEVFYNGMIKYEKEMMHQRIRKRGMEFDWKEKAKQYLTVYQSLY